jgi:aspartyl-tRNA(Asn)/glutamyl-tRNA(Gln) amidotransferase subunit A
MRPAPQATADADVELPFATISQAASWIREGRLTSVGLTERMLARIESTQDKLNAFVTVTAERALEQAREADRERAGGIDRGPLHGIPVAVKDLFLTNGVRTTGGTRRLAAWIPDRDATAVRRLREAGAIVLGKTGLHELAWGTTSINPHYGRIANPWDIEHHPGGSSGGSAAAVAAGLAYAALGTDTGASVRQPAHCCGIVGHKPTFGVVSKAGVIPLVWSMDHVGPLARSVADAALVLTALAGPDDEDPDGSEREPENFSRLVGAPIDGAVVGVQRAYFFEGGDPEVTGLAEEALETFRRLGARVEHVEIPDLEPALAAARTTFVEALAAHGRTVAEHPADFSPHIHRNMEDMGRRTASEYVEAQRFRAAFRKRVAVAMRACDVIAMPTATVAAEAFRDDPPDRTPERWRNTGIFNFTGQPAISVPCGFTRAGLPIGLMIVGRAFEDATVFRFAHAFEQATPWHERHPTL